MTSNLVIWTDKVPSKMNKFVVEDVTHVRLSESAVFSAVQVVCWFCAAGSGSTRFLMCHTFIYEI